VCENLVSRKYRESECHDNSLIIYLFGTQTRGCINSNILMTKGYLIILHKLMMVGKVIKVNATKVILCQLGIHMII